MNKPTIIETAARVGKQLAQPAPPPPTEAELKAACAGAMKKSPQDRGAM